MSENSVSRGSTNGAVGSEIKFAGNDKEKMYEPKHRRKLVRVLTVIAYLFSVSLAAIMLSLFYVFIYNPAKPSEENSQDHAFSRFTPHVSQEFLDSLNDTYLNMDREEPRALPVKEIDKQFWNNPEGMAEDDPIHFNYSVAPLIFPLDWIEIITQSTVYYWYWPTTFGSSITHMLCELFLTVVPGNTNMLYVWLLKC